MRTRSNVYTLMKNENTKWPTALVSYQKGVAAMRAYEIAKRIRAGMIYINGGGAGSSPHTAFGGYKHSGLGLERGEYGLDEFLLSKSIIWSAR